MSAGSSPGQRGADFDPAVRQAFTQAFGPQPVTSGSLVDTYTRWRAMQDAVGTDDTHALAKSARKLAKQLLKGTPQDQALTRAFTTYAKHGGRRSYVEWARRLGG